MSSLSRVHVCVSLCLARKPTASYSPPAGIKAGDIWQGVGRCSPGAGLRSALVAAMFFWQLSIVECDAMRCAMPLNL